jgi:Protein of unknown function (DUF2877)
MLPTPLSVMSIGSLVDRGRGDERAYQIHSRFQKVLNLVDAQGSLLTLLGSDFQDFPTAVRVALPAGWDWQRGLDPSQLVILRDSVLQGITWSVDLNYAPRWEPASPAAQAAGSLNAVLAASRILADQLAQYCRHHGVRSALQLQPGWPGRKPRLNVADERNAVEYTVSELIGFGSGLTPDGDDYLLGYLAALWPWQRFTAIASHLKLMQDVVRLQLHRTTSISGHFLTLALQGHYSQPIDHLTTVLMQGDSLKEVVVASNKVMEFGSASGADCLAGYINGINALETVAQPQVTTT